MIGKIKKFIEKLHGDSFKAFMEEVRWIYGYTLRNKGAVIWYIFTGVLSTVLGLAAGYTSKLIIDAVTGKQTDLILVAAISYVGMQVFQIIVNALTGRVSLKIKLRVNLELRREVFDKIMLADWENVSAFHSGDLLNRLNGDVDAVSGSVVNLMPSFITSAVQFIGAFAMIFYYDPVLAFLSLMSAPFMFLASRVMMTKMRSFSLKIRQASSDMMAYNEEAFQNIQYIKSFGLINRFSEGFSKEQDKYRDVQLEYNRFSIAATVSLSFVGLFVSGLTFGWGAYRLWTDAITYGTLMLFMQMSGSLSGAFSGMVRFFPNLIYATASAGRIIEVTKIPAEQDVSAEEAQRFAKETGSDGVSVILDNVSFAYSGGDEVLESASLSAYPNKITALVGSSGEGKTTVFSILLGLVGVSSGSARLESKHGEIDISTATRRLFALVPQGNTMMSGTVAENLRLINDKATDEEIWEALKTACADEFVRELPEGIDTYLRERGVGLSEGQLQRLAIARALLCDAPILLLDESTSALDPDTEKRLMENISRMKRKRTCIIITHREGILSICDGVYRAVDRKLVKEEPNDVLPPASQS